MSNVELKQQLDEKQLAIVQSEMEHRKKSTVIAYLLWFFLGSLGAHRFYVRKFGTAVTILILDLLGWATVWIFGLGLIFLIPVGIWLIIDAFLLHGIVSRLNQQIERDILQQVLHQT
ncbi:TM2 domain-containing protein [Novibacillus thermophilus]|uniref:TM2 domain-containing protein n=1 Tax=Novibacillus thermophilus TaxID=1471761 RepID=A0A1U9K3K0_9BACL|nr:TM2 domain-containing protein [Novibacillus thermophilus]AQS54604.1 hypothetical protein B0W44_01200 [Novibacillus thermophilus]